MIRKPVGIWTLRLLPIAIVAALVAGAVVTPGEEQESHAGPASPPAVVAAAGGEEPAAEATAPAPVPTPAPPSPAVLPAVASPAPSSSPVPTPAPTAAPPSSAPPASPATPRPTSAGIALPTHRVATRVAVPALGIDLPVMRQMTSYPACNVAMYLRELRQPGQGGVTYLYSHARVGNFLPLLEESRINDGQRMLGMTVRVWTGDNYLFTYRIIEVRRHVTDFAPAFAWQGESVWLQTSEGPRGTVPKLQVIAEHVRTEPTDYASAHPVPRPVSCS
jgi:hypothetical protein